MAGDMDGAKVEPSPFDIWLDDRLSGQSDPTWLAPHSTGASAMFCRMFGKGMLAGAQAEDPIHQRHNAAAAGFTVVREGPEAIKSNLINLAACGETGSDPVRQAHRRMFEALDTHLLDDPSFDVFRTVLRDTVLNIWPIAAGEAVLGAVLDERVLHSVTSAAVETGVSINRLRRMLVEAGALAADDPRPNARATFDAMAFAPLLADISRLVDRKAMCNLLGATAVELDTLQASGILRSHTTSVGARQKWLPADGQVLLNELKEHSVHSSIVTTDEDGWVTIQLAQARTGVSVGDIIAGIRKGDIPVRHVDPDAGYRGFHISLEAVSVYGERFAERELLSEGLSLAELGRSIGIREINRLMALIDAGELRAMEVIHPVTRRRQWRVMEVDAAKFRCRFLTFSMIQAEFAVPRMTARLFIKQAGVVPYAPEGQDFGNLFLRADVEALIRQRGGLGRVAAKVAKRPEAERGSG